ncbi:hypothetical protein, partial [Klebsiella pneumoniae]|uniref:hypothetical protein n=1 Tax=Klebsiella pneumoniae TaxID=573 RepID=UPI003EBA2958
MTLIGAEYYYKFVHPNYKQVDDLVLLPTIYGYALSGTSKSMNPTTNVEVVTILKVATHPVDEYLQDTKSHRDIKDLAALWELDHIGISSN